jgi:arabinofuranan 3-O-arabinosyltransferase
MTVGAGPESYLEVHQAASAGWTATLNGKTLAPVTLDGWQQAFVLPAGGAGTVIMTYAPVNSYHDVLIGASVAFALVLAAACWRRRPGGFDGAGTASPPGEGPVPGFAAEGSRGYFLAVVGAAAVLAGVGGPLGEVIVAVTVLSRWRRDWVPWLAFAAMAAAGIAVLAGLGDGPSAGDGAFGWPAQAAALIALAAALTPSFPDRDPGGQAS